MANVKKNCVQTYGQMYKRTNGRTGQKLYAPDLLMRGHKNNGYIFLLFIVISK